MHPATEARFTSRGIPRRLWPLLDGGALDETDAILAVRAFTGGILVLAGGVGSGKTCAACSLLADRSGRFRRASDLQRAGFFDQAELAKFFSADLLVLDDVGSEHADRGGAFVAAFEDLVNRRYDDARDTIITTNVRVMKRPGEDRSPFVQRYGDRIADRLREVGRIVELDNKSLRKRQRPTEGLR